MRLPRIVILANQFVEWLTHPVNKWAASLRIINLIVYFNVILLWMARSGDAKLKNQLMLELNQANRRINQVERELHQCKMETLRLSLIIDSGHTSVVLPSQSFTQNP